MHAEMKISILEDGTIKVVTDGPVPEEHHQNAEEFLQFIQEKTGGERVTEKLRDGEHHHTHTHKDGNVHSH